MAPWHRPIASCGLRSWRTSFAASAALALFVATVGIAPHVWFSLRTGQATFFEAAYDEDTYVRVTAAGSGRPDRVLASTLFRGVHAITGNLDVTLALFDAIFPAFAALAAFALAAVLTPGTPGRVLVAMLLLFGQELFSLGSATVTWLLPAGWSLAHIRGWFAASRPDLVPDYYTSYFSIFRTPEPQVSLAPVFLHLAGVIALVSGRGRRYRPWLLAGLLGSHALMIYEYAPLFVAVITLEGLAGLGLLLTGCRRQAGELAVTMVPFGALGMLREWAPTADQFLLRSSVPSLTPAVLYSVLLLVVVVTIAWYRWMPFDSPEFGLVIACAAVPLVLMNQQIITAVMLSTRDFERYSNYPPLVLAAVIVAGVAGSRWGVGAVVGPLTTIAVAGLGLVVILGHWETVAQFRGSNEASVAMARAIRTAVASGEAPPRVLLDEVGLAPLVVLRLHPMDVEFILDYGALVLRHIPPSADTGESARATRVFHQERLFEYFARTGLSVEDVAKRLGDEAASIGSSSAFLLHFLFPLQDVWYPMSDNRRVRPDAVRAALPTIVGDYARFLAEPPRSLERPVLYVIRRDQPPPIGPGWSYRTVATGTLPAVPAYVAYIQALPGASRDGMASR